MFNAVFIQKVKGRVPPAVFQRCSIAHCTGILNFRGEEHTKLRNPLINSPAILQAKGYQFQLANKMIWINRSFIQHQVGQRF